MAESTALQAKYKITKSDVVQTNTLSKGQKITQLEGTGTLKMNKISSYMIKLLLADIKRDHAGYYDHNSIERSSITWNRKSQNYRS